MNSSFRAVIAEYKRPVTLTHAQRVTRLYRAALRTADSWACDRNLFIEEGRKIRQQFDDNKALDASSGCVGHTLLSGSEARRLGCRRWAARRRFSAPRAWAGG